MYAGSSGTATDTFGGSSAAQEQLGDNLTINSGVTVTLSGTDYGLVMTNKSNINNEMGTLVIEPGGTGKGGITNASGSSGTLTNVADVFITGATSVLSYEFALKVSLILEKINSAEAVPTNGLGS